MSLLQSTIRSRMAGPGPRGKSSRGRFYCSVCGKRSHRVENVEQHITDRHKGSAEVLREPTKLQLVRALIISKELADRAEEAATSLDYAYRDIDAETSADGDKLREAVAKWRKAVE